VNAIEQNIVHEGGLSCQTDIPRIQLSASAIVGFPGGEDNKNQMSISGIKTRGP
jgi:hypothetical protein